MWFHLQQCCLMLLHFFIRVLSTVVVLVSCYVIREERNQAFYKQLPVKRNHNLSFICTINFVV